MSPQARCGFFLFALLASAPSLGADLSRLVIPFGHSGPVRDAAISADRRWLVTGGDDGVVILWDLETGRPVSRYPEHKNAIDTIAVSRKGETIFSSQEIRRGELLQSATGAIRSKFTTEPDWIEDAALSSDGSILALSISHNDETFDVTTVDVNTGHVLRHSPLYDRRPRSLKFFANDQKLFGYIEATAVINWETRNLVEVGRSPMDAFGLAVFDDADNVQLKLTGPGRGHLALSILNDKLSPAQPTIGLPGIDGLDGHTLAVSPNRSWLAHGDTSCNIDLAYLPDPSKHTRFHAAFDRFGSTDTLVLSFLDDDHLFVGCQDGTLAVWDIGAQAQGGQPSPAISSRVNPKIEFERRAKMSFLGETTALALANTISGPRRMDVDPPPPNIRLLDAISGRDVDIAGRILALNPKNGNMLTIQRLDEDVDPPQHEFTLWSANGPTQVSSIKRGFYPASEIAYLADGQHLLYATIYGQLYQLRADSFEIETQYVPASQWRTTCLVPHPGSDLFIQCTEYGLRVFRSGNPLPIAEFNGNDVVMDAVFDTDDQSVLFAGRNGVWRFNFRTGGQPELVVPVSQWNSDPETQFVRTLAISPVDGSLVLGADGGKLISVPRSGTAFGAPRRIWGPYEDVRRVVFSPDKKLLLAANLGIDLFDAATLEPKLSVFETSNGSWIAIDPTGRFDTNNFDILGDFRWRLSGHDLLSSISFEALMEPYFTPGLIGTVLQGKLPEIVAENGLREELPEVSIDSARLIGQARAEVTVKVKPGSSAASQQTTAFNLKLFRDGQLVAGTSGEIQKSHEAKIASDGTIEVTYGVMLPRDPAVSDTVFSAYAFNGTGVRSVPSKPFHLALQGRTGQSFSKTMYVIAIGINANDNSSLVLSHAVASAEVFLDGFPRAVDLAGLHYQLVKIPIEARSPGRLIPGERKPAVLPADKKTILGVLDILAGRNANTDGWPPEIVESLKPVGADDAVVLYVAAHGIAQENVFQIMPQDTTPGFDVTSGALCSCAITDSELATSFAAIDARHLVVVLDTCSSASAVTAEGRKPGPFNGAKLGQLIYDKQMIVMSSSEPTKRATALGKTNLTQAFFDDALAAKGLWTYPSHSSLKDLLDYVELIAPSLGTAGVNEAERARFYRLSKSIEDRAREITLRQPAGLPISTDSSSGGGGEDDKP
ncbi:WD40 repeat domain-containing protein [Mesorhizobium sp. NZP2298]|uniref:WD40 repeat domain-containing protein n=1 Tax=Mesorhizobium sp. NZP2298 TaxID=2483403 RepID=UPI001551BC34|nr:WD40 repeat domain-containing protein [Mesorhizobium sp. NZP2298]QKC98339.1 hypothetical protein EB231_29620 [Mesorhizobium sp. NZP2298]